MSNEASSIRQEKQENTARGLIIYLAFCLAVLLTVTCLTLRSAQRIGSMSVSGNAEVPIGEITAGTVVCQSVPVDDPLTSVSVLFATWMRTNSGTVDIEIVGTNSGTVYLHEQLPAADFADNAYVTFEPYSPILPSDDRTLNIVVTADSAPGEALTIWSSAEDTIPNAPLTINGQEQSGDLVVQAVYEDTGAVHRLVGYNVIVTAGLLALLYLSRKLWARALRTVQTELREHKGRFVWRCVLLLAPALAALALWYVRFAGHSVNTCLYFLLGGLAVGALLAFRDQAGEHPERLFLAVTLCIGVSFVSLLPTSSVVSWDDEYHYRNALAVAYAGNAPFSSADMVISGQRYDLSHRDPGYESFLDNQFLNEWHTGNVSFSSIKTDPYQVPAFIPMGAGLWLGNTLGLPFSVCFALGRIGNLLCYALAFYFAIKRMKQGGMLLAGFALIPTALFLACNYSYDPFCTAFLALGTAIFVDEYRHSERPMSWKTAALMLLCMVLGCAAKRIYVPIFLICFFMPKEKFASSKQRKRYLLVVAAVMGLVLLSFAAPFVFQSASDSLSSDMRGGADVNAGAQVRGILKDPFGYVALLLRFLFGTYLQPREILIGCINFWAYLSDFVPRFGGTNIALVLLAVTFVMEYPRQDRLKKPSLLVKIVSAVAFFGAISMAATALYIDFTAVGSETVAGCQERYMLPVLLPMLMVLRPFSVRNPIPLKYYNWTILAVETALWIAGLWPLMLCYVI